MDKKGGVRWLKKAQLKFGYRRSNLNRFIVLEMVLKLVKRNPEGIKRNIAAFLERKRKVQHLNAKSAGCIFKNPDYPLTAGEMIDACGLKGLRWGGAAISVKHANFIINRNRATAGEILHLMELARGAVRKKFGILLDPEIKVVR
jgi:UDP-N-acetylmuramate dehydrogenase